MSIYLSAISVSQLDAAVYFVSVPFSIRYWQAGHETLQG